MKPDTLSKVMRLPCFQSPSDVVALGGGITNVNLRMTDKGRHFVVRLGDDIPEHGVMRWNELVISKAAEAAGVSPGVFYHEPGVLVLEFLDATTFDEAAVRDQRNLPRVVELLKTAHRELATHLTSPVLAFWPFQVNRAYAKRLRADGSTHSTALPNMMADLEMLEAATGPVSLVLGHGDLLAANILDDGKRLWLIDWEYGGFNTPLFDLAGLASNNSLPEELERSVLELYFESSPEPHWRAYQAMKCTSLMRETLWSMASEIHSEIDFDYAAYTAENLSRLNAALKEFNHL